MTQDEALFAQLITNLHAQNVQPVLNVDLPTLIAVTAQLQLAQRHPGNRGESAQIGRRFIDRIINGLDTQSPGIGALLRRGDDPAHDVAQPPATPSGEATLKITVTRHTTGFFAYLDDDPTARHGSGSTPALAVARLLAAAPAQFGEGPAAAPEPAAEAGPVRVVEDDGDPGFPP